MRSTRTGHPLEGDAGPACDGDKGTSAATMINDLVR
jgi:hypothetical protein